MASFKTQLKLICQGSEEVLQVSELEKKLKRFLQDKIQLTVKFGVDPTSPDLHLGHAIALRKLRDFQELGHQVVLVIGDFTAQIGDPSARVATRPQLSSQEIKVNAKTYTDQAFKILDKDKTRVNYNSRWFLKMSFEDLLRLAAKFTVARLIERDDFRARLSKGLPIGLHEFLYPVMQAYDSVVLRADVEVGGTDQKFNMLAGRELQVDFGQEPQVVVTLPILEGIDGKKKMSKSLGNQIGLTDPPPEMFGKIMSIPDKLMLRYFKLATSLSQAEIRRVEKGLEEGKLHPAEVKRRLGKEVVALYWGREQAEAAESEFDTVFRKKELPPQIPQKILGKHLFQEGKIWIVKLLKATGFAKSGAEARRLIEQGGVKINRERVASSELDVKIKGGDILQVGRRRFVKLLLD